MHKQVDQSHYTFVKYVQKRRWASMWHQLDEVIKHNPVNVLEIGPGPGVFKALMNLFEVHVETLDIDPALKPDHVASVFDMPFVDDAFDVVCAFQMLEHLPFEKSLEAVGEMARVARKALVISLPDAAVRWPMSIYIPKIGPLNFSIPKPRFRAQQHQLDREHCWEINKAGYPLKSVKKEFLRVTSMRLARTFRVAENPYHRFFIFETSPQCPPDAIERAPVKVLTLGDWVRK